MLALHFCQSFQNDTVVLVFIEFAHGEKKKIVISNSKLIPEDVSPLIGERVKNILI